MIITTGLGILVPISGVVFPLVARWIFNTFTGDPTYYQDHPYLFYYSLMLAAYVCFEVGRRMNARHEVNNPESPDESWGRKIFRTMGSHTIFFIPMETFAWLLPVIGWFVKNQWGIY